MINKSETTSWVSPCTTVRRKKEKTRTTSVTMLSTVFATTTRDVCEQDKLGKERENFSTVPPFWALNRGPACFAPRESKQQPARGDGAPPARDAATRPAVLSPPPPESLNFSNIILFYSHKFSVSHTFKRAASQWMETKMAIFPVWWLKIGLSSYSSYIVAG